MNYGQQEINKAQAYPPGAWNLLPRQNQVGAMTGLTALC